MLTYAQKQEAVAELKEKFERATSVIVADYRGLDVAEVNELRANLHKAGKGVYEYRVVKNSLLRRAAEGSQVEQVAGHFQGPTAVAISFEDPAGLAKSLVQYAKQHEAFELRAGILDGRAIEPEEIRTLATLPSLDELRGMLVGLIQAPAQKIAAVLAAPPTQLARVMDARRAQLEASSGESA